MKSPIQQQIIVYSDDLKKELDARSETHQKLIQRGLLLNRHQLVHGLRFGPGKVSAVVHDVTPAFVELNLLDSELSTCACHEGGICRHQAAVFFSALERSGVESPFSWIQSWKESWEIQDVLSTLKRGSDLLKEEVPQKSYEQWLQRIRTAFAHPPQQNVYTLVEWAHNQYRRLLGFAPVEREWKPLFRLFAAVETLKIMREQWLELYKSEDSAPRPVLNFNEFLVEEAEDALNLLSAAASPFAFDEYYRYLKEESARYLEMNGAFSHPFIDLYLDFWQMLFTAAAERETELDRLLAQPADWRHSAARIHLAILLEKDDLAIERIKEEGDWLAVYAIRWLKGLQAGKSKARLERFLPVLLEKIMSHIHGMPNTYEQSLFVRFLLQTIETESLPLASRESIYMDLLPHSLYHYLAFLLEQEDYRRWAELQAYSDRSLEFMDRKTIELIAKAEPSALFPLYHRVIQDFINQRNRDSYRKAVRYLKRLQKLYKKEKLLGQWDLFIEELMKRTKRLRAFQEECRKGKLIDDEA